LVHAEKPQGRFQTTWDGRLESGEQASTGIYIYRLVTPGYAVSHKMSLIR